MAGDFAGLNRKIGKLTEELSGTAGRKRLERVARKAVKEVDAAVKSTLGDDSMSGWKRGNPLPVRGMVEMTPVVAIVPARRSRGPMRVLESGRNMGNAGGMAGPGVSADGTTRRNKNGSVRKTRTRKAKRWNGTTSGKGTWTDAQQRVQSVYPALVADEVDEAMAKFFKRG